MLIRRPITLVSERPVASPAVGDGVATRDAVALREWPVLFFFFFFCFLFQLLLIQKLESIPLAESGSCSWELPMCAGRSRVGSLVTAFKKEKCCDFGFRGFRACPRALH